MRQEHTCPQQLRLRDADLPDGIGAYGAAVYSVWTRDGRAFVFGEEIHGVEDGPDGLSAEYATEIQFCPFCGLRLGGVDD